MTTPFTIWPSRTDNTPPQTTVTFRRRRGGRDRIFLYRLYWTKYSNWSPLLTISPLTCNVYEILIPNVIRMKYWHRETSTPRMWWCNSIFMYLYTNICTHKHVSHKTTSRIDNTPSQTTETPRRRGCDGAFLHVHTWIHPVTNWRYSFTNWQPCYEPRGVFDMMACFYKYIIWQNPVTSSQNPVTNHRDTSTPMMWWRSLIWILSRAPRARSLCLAVIYIHYIYTHTYIHTHIHVHIHAYAQMHTHAHTHTYMHINTCTDAHIYMHTVSTTHHAHTHTHLCVCV